VLWDINPCIIFFTSIPIYLPSLWASYSTVMNSLDMFIPLWFRLQFLSVLARIRTDFTRERRHKRVLRWICAAATQLIQRIMTKDNSSEPVLCLAQRIPSRTVDILTKLRISRSHFRETARSMTMRVDEVTRKGRFSETDTGRHTPVPLKAERYSRASTGQNISKGTANDSGFQS